MITKTNAASNYKLENCQHSTLITEYAYGSPTGNLICAKCEHLIPANFEQLKVLNNAWATHKLQLESNFAI
ncbi:hypothetical protein [Methylomonas sp. AM2-LC]|uniref:hypothetical protein n=1 Tax=Methylomonas sp. AM2-LC TaxID=3153301 RepID=UPI0032662A65